MRVAYLGPDGTVSHEALIAVPGAEAFELVPEPTLHDAIVAVHDGTVDRALVPIENALEGAVNPTLDAIAFETDDVVIVGELRHPVHLCLLAGRPLGARRDRDGRVTPAGQRPVRPLPAHGAAGRPGRRRVLDGRGRPPGSRRR